MKKVLSLILALTLVFALSVPVLAVDPQSGTVTVSTSVNETYTISIPTGTKTLTWGSTEAQVFGDIGLSAVQITPNHQITITISENDTLKNTLDNSKTIAYTVKDGANIFSSANFTDTTLKSLTIVVEQTAWNNAPAGTYEDIVTFTASITDIPTT